MAIPQGPSADPPTNWSTIYASAVNLSGLLAVSCFDASNCLAVGSIDTTATASTSYVAYTHDGGTTWSDHQFADTGTLYGAACTSTLTCVAVGADDSSTPNPHLIGYQTTNGGSSWEPITFPAAATGVGSAVQCPTATTCYMVVRGSATISVVKSVDGGATWSVVYTSTTTLGSLSYGNAISCPTESVCDVVTNELAFSTGLTITPEDLVTSDGGSTWALKQMGPSGVTGSTTLPDAVNAVSCPTISYCVAAGMQFPLNLVTGSVTYGQGVTWVSNDGGTTWTHQLSGPAATPTTGSSLNSVSCPSTVSCVVVGNTYEITSSGQVYYFVPRAAVIDVSSDGGRTWTADSAPEPPNPVNATLTAAVTCLSASQCFISGGVGNGAMAGIPSLYAVVLGSYLGPPPTVSAISPRSGVAGTVVTIDGTGFYSTTAVHFGTVRATVVTIDSSTTVTVAAPPGTGTVEVTVTSPGGTSAPSPADTFSYPPPPVISLVTPQAGPPAGGTAVTIDGSHFTGVTAVAFGSIPAPDFTIASDTEIDVISPPVPPNIPVPAEGLTVSISVAGPGGSSPPTAADTFTYSSPPTVTSLFPAAGEPSGGGTVEIHGTGLFQVVNGNQFQILVSAVYFGTTAATGIAVGFTAPTCLPGCAYLEAVAPPHGVGVVDVTAVSAAGTSPVNSGDRFTYTNPPVVTSISPDSGPETSPNAVTITGNGFTFASAVAGASTFTVVSDSEIDAVLAPISNPGDRVVQRSITVTNPLQSSYPSPADQFTYLPVPYITAINPPEGPAGTTVTIFGTGLFDATEVTFGSRSTTAIRVVVPTDATHPFDPNNARLVVVVPEPSVPVGSGLTVNVQVSTPGGRSSVLFNPATFRYLPLPSPAISHVDPPWAPVSGGTSVTINGQDFVDVTAVQFAAVAATSYSVVSDSQITAIVPPSATGPGVVDVTVTNASGTSLVVPSDQMTYVTPTPPIISSISPTSGYDSGGPYVTFHGSNFLDVTHVYFGSTEASLETLRNPFTSLSAGRAADIS